MSYGIRMVPNAERTAAAAAITSAVAFTAIGARFDVPIRIINIKNLTDQTLAFSYDGITVHETLPAGGFLLLDITANRTNNLNGGAFMAVNTQIFVRRVGIPTTGAVYVSSYYCVGD